MIIMNLEERIVDKLKAKKYTVATAESCTGGLIAATIINVSGSSSVINESHVTYANEAKMKYLQVEEAVLNTVGAVSYECAYQMAKGVKKLANAEVGLASTGIAGPTGGSKEKPVGTVFTAIAIEDKVLVYENHFEGNRQAIREQTVTQILTKLEELL